ncbi:ribbon-helix-helix domain-containing protein [Peptococcaceae bacterium 1198_IL3148]
MRKNKTITISLPIDLVDYLDRRIQEINQDTFEETNRSKYIRLLIRKDMTSTEDKPEIKKAVNGGLNSGTSADEDYYNSLLQLGGYKR